MRPETLGGFPGRPPATSGYWQSMKVIVIAVIILLAVLGGGAYLLYYANSMEPPQRSVTKVLPDEQFPQPK